MTHAKNLSGQGASLSVSDLFSRYLDKQIEAHGLGLGHPEFGDEATPFESVPVQPVDSQLAWKDALTAARLLHPNPTTWTVPPQWPVLVGQQEPAVALAFSLGNFPQMVRNLQPLLGDEPASLRQGPGAPLAVPGLGEWALEQRDEPMRYLAAGLFRLARQFDRAEELLAVEASPEWRVVQANERAALAWHRGESEKARQLWAQMGTGAVASFNRGMAALFLGERAGASECLERAIAALPETSAWHHLAQLYRALAQG